MDETAGQPRYRLGPRSRRGLIAGWRGGQIACVATGLLVGIFLLRSIGGLGGLLTTVLVTSISVAAATWPLQGLSAEEWAPTIARFALESVAEGGFRPWATRARPARGALAHLAVRQLPGNETIGVVTDQECGTWTAVIPVGGDGFALVSEAERGERIAAWSGVLAAVASEGTGPHRLQWVARTYPTLLDGPPGQAPPGIDGQIAEEEREPVRPAAALPVQGFADPSLPAPATAYRQLLDDVAGELWSREVLVAVTVKAALGRRAGADAAAEEVRHQLEAMSERLRAAGLHPGRPLSLRSLAACLRRSFDLGSLGELTFWPWPVGIEDGWGWLHTDESWQATYWISEWPRTDVGTEWLLPMLLGAGQRRTLSVTMAPVPPLRAVRRAERERTSGAADAELRRRHGFAVTARARREQEGRQQREVELADGHAGFRYSGYVTVTTATFEELGEACRRVEQAAAASQLELRRLFGSQRDGFLCTLPVGRGCR